MRALPLLVLLLGGCSAVAEPGPATPSPNPRTEGTDDYDTKAAPTPSCGPHPDRLWHELSNIELERPGTPAEPDLSLPDGMSAPPRANRRQMEGCSPVGGIRALSGIELELCCEQGQADASHFPRGCLMPSRCRYRDAQGHEAGTPTELAALLAPIDSRERALATVALLHPELAEPATLQTESNLYAFEPLPNAPAAFEVNPVEDGYVVRAPAYATCGCTHHAVRLTFAVARDGCVSRLDEPPEPIAWSKGLCVD